MRKYVHNINDNEVQSCFSENYLTWKIIARNIFDMKYSWFTVSVFKACKDRYLVELYIVCLLLLSCTLQ